MSAFAQLLASLIKSVHAGNKSAFLRAARDTTSGASSYLGQVLRDKKPPPMERIERWADAVKLQGSERTRFLDLAAIAHMPDVVQSRFVGIIDKVALIEARQDAIESRRQRGQK